MLIAPGSPQDRRWFPRSYVLHFMRPTELRWEPDLELASSDSPWAGTATMRRYKGSGWRIVLEFFVDDSLPCDPDTGPIIPDGYVLPGFIQGHALGSWPLMHWKLNKREDRWELWPAGGEDCVARVTREFMRVLGEETTQEQVIRTYRVPLPDEAWRPKQPPEVPMPRRTLRELLMILDGANEQDGD